MRSAVLALAVLAVACTEPAAESPAVSCAQAPDAVVEAVSTLDMTATPNPAGPREEVDLIVESRGLPEGSLVGIDAQWQCWNGSEWATTHIVYRGFGDNAGQTIAVNTDFQIQVPSIGLALDEGYPIVIPQVDPGVYRIEDEVIVNGDAVPGFVVVEVTAG